MSELKRSKCLEQIHNISYRSLNNLESSGRYITALRHSQSLEKDENEKLNYEYSINQCLYKHIIFLQESIINSYGKKTNLKIIPLNLANTIKKLAKSNYAVSQNNISLVDVEGLKKLQTIKKAVILKDNLVLPCKVKSENQKYKFNTHIIMTKENVLSYASNSLEYEGNQNNIYHNVLLTKVGKGIKDNELIKKYISKIAIK